MKLEIQKAGRYELITVETELNVVSDITELKYIISGYIQQGRRHIVISFKNASYIYSGAIGILVDCQRLLANTSDGGLYIIEPNQQIRNVFDTLNLDSLFRIINSLDDIPDLNEDTGTMRKRSSGFQSVI